MIEETGRARAYNQRNSLDIENAVMVSIGLCCFVGL